MIKKEIAQENILCLLAGIMLALLFLALMFGDVNEGWFNIL